MTRKEQEMTKKKIRFVDLPWSYPKEFFDELYKPITNDNAAARSKLIDDWLRGGKFHPLFSVHTHRKAIEIVSIHQWTAPYYAWPWVSWETNSLAEKRRQAYVIEMISGKTDLWKERCKKVRDAKAKHSKDARYINEILEWLPICFESDEELAKSFGTLLRNQRINWITVKEQLKLEQEGLTEDQRKILTHSTFSTLRTLNGMIRRYDDLIRELEL